MYNQMQVPPQPRQTPTSSTPVHIQMQMQMQMQLNAQMRQTPTNPYKNFHPIDFKKQSKTMAIQYKNKIKEHINKN